MIRILAHGKRYTQCHKCGCVFEFEHEDIESKTIDFGEPKFAFKSEYVTCPDCGTIVYIKEVEAG